MELHTVLGPVLFHFICVLPAFTKTDTVSHLIAKQDKSETPDYSRNSTYDFRDASSVSKQL